MHPLKKLLSGEEFYRELEKIYVKSGIKMFFEDYMKIFKFSPFIAAFSTFTLFTVLHFLFLRYNIVLSLLLATIPGLIAGLLTFLVITYYPLLMMKNRASSIDATLTYTLAFMAALAAGGLSVIDIFSELLEVEENRDIKEEAAAFLKDTTLGGLDVSTALERAAKRSPSRMLERIFEGIRQTIITSGNLTGFLEFIVERLIDEKRRMLLELSNALGLLSEAYITLMVAGPVIFAIILGLASMLGGGIMGLDPILLLIFFTFILLPLSSLGILVLIDSWLSRV